MCCSVFSSLLAETAGSATACGQDVTSRAADKCNFAQECELEAVSRDWGNPQCTGTAYLEVRYECRTLMCVARRTLRGFVFVCVAAVLLSDSILCFLEGQYCVATVLMSDSILCFHEGQYCIHIATDVH